MSDGWGKLTWVLVPLVLAIGAAWVYARYDLADRVSDFHARVGELGYARGGRLPSEDEVRAHVTESAAEAELDVETLQVQVRREQGLDAPGQLLADGAARVGSGEAPRLSMELAHYDIRATVRGDRWLWSTEAEVDRTVTLRGRVTLDGR